MKNKSEGINKSEKVLSKLCYSTFLNLWTYPNAYCQHGVELCDCLIICGDTVLIFSDKNIKFNTDKEMTVAWRRWYRKAIEESKSQLLGAERWIKANPDKIFLDRKGAVQIPIPNPKIKNLKVHLIAVATGASVECQKYFRDTEKVVCSGSLAFDAINTEIDCFTVSDLNPTGTFIHVFDEISLPILLKELDTITDFIEYLEEKEKNIREHRIMSYVGEENLLATYLIHFDNINLRHVFYPVDNNAGLTILEIGESDYSAMTKNPQYLAKKKADEISKFWDDLIERTASHLMNGTSVSPSHSIKETDSLLRHMAIESRVKRRLFSEMFFGFLKKIALETDKHSVDNRLYHREVLGSQDKLAYSFVILGNGTKAPYDEYRKVRREVLGCVCMAARTVWGRKCNVEKILGIAMEHPEYHEEWSEDLLLLEAEEWSDGEVAESLKCAKQLNIFRDESVKNMFSVHGYEYPPDNAGGA